jgi:hypothetical protein
MLAPVRTTLTLEDDAFATAQACAKSRAMKLGQAVSELIRRSSAHPQHCMATLDFGFGQVLATYTGGLLGHRQITGAWLHRMNGLRTPPCYEAIF